MCCYISSNNYLLGEKEANEIIKSLISPGIQKDLDNLEYLSSLSKNKVLKEVDYYRGESRFYHKLITASLVFMRFIGKFIHKTKF